MPVSNVTWNPVIPTGVFFTVQENVGTTQRYSSWLKYLSLLTKDRAANNYSC
jgi:hypothetical protein